MCVHVLCVIALMLLDVRTYVWAGAIRMPEMFLPLFISYPFPLRHWPPVHVNEVPGTILWEAIPLVS